MREYRVVRLLPIVPEPVSTVTTPYAAIARLELDDLRRYYAKHDDRVRCWIEVRDVPPWKPLEESSN